MTRMNVRNGPHPSIWAASSNSLGSDFMNCTMRKIKKALVAMKLGTINGR